MDSIKTTYNQQKHNEKSPNGTWRNIEQQIINDYGIKVYNETLMSSNKIYPRDTVRIIEPKGGVRMFL